MRVLITGGAGFIGSQLARACVEAGDEVRVLDDLSSGSREQLAPGGQLELVVGSVTDAGLLERAAKSRDVIYHFAAQSSVARSLAAPLESHAINTTGTLNALEAARRNSVARFVFASSCAVYGDGVELPAREDLRTAPRSAYAAQKLLGERYCAHYHEHAGIETLALRFFNVYGPGQDPYGHAGAVIPSFLCALTSGEPPVLHGDGRQGRDFLWVGDAVAAARAAAAAPATAAGRVFNAGTGVRTEIAELLDRMAAILGLPQLRVRNAPARAGDLRESTACVLLARAALAWRAELPLDQGLKRMLAFGEGRV